MLARFSAEIVSAVRLGDFTDNIDAAVIYDLLPDIETVVLIESFLLQRSGGLPLR